MLYLDANSTAKLRPQAAKAISELFSEQNAPARNPSSVHTPGRRARGLLRRARMQVLDLLGLSETVAGECVFVSGGTEACNQMVFGFLGPLTNLSVAPAHILSTSIEHAAVSVPLARLEDAGWSVTRVAPSPVGVIDVDSFVASLEPTTALVTLMLANNETGALQPVAEIARALRVAKYQGPIVCDMVQALGKARCSVNELFSAGVNAVAVSGHKIGGPSGIGALVISSSDSTCFLQQSLLSGGPQEQRLRGGTENLLGAVGFGAAAEATLDSLESDLRVRSGLREQLWQRISQSLPGVRRLGPQPDSAHSLLSNTLLLQVAQCRGDDLVAALDINGLAASTGSACSSGRQEVSASVRALGLPEAEAAQVIRLSLDWDVTQDLVEEASAVFVSTVEQMRCFSNDDSSPAHVNL